jgi:hypothetical protein
VFVYIVNGGMGQGQWMDGVNRRMEKKKRQIDGGGGGNGRGYSAVREPGAAKPVD